VQACTGIRLIAEDGTIIHARTMEFAIDIHSDVIMVPRGCVRTGTTPDGKEGLKWKAKYASVGLNGVGLPVLFDGLNEKGLAAGTFYFPTSAGYMPYTAADAGKTIAQWEVGSWILENFASVEEVKANIGNIVVPAVVFGGWGFAPEAHYIVHDASGKSIVIEYVGGKLNVYNNPLGVITNSPAFDWHMTNLRNYVNFSMTNGHSQDFDEGRGKHQVIDPLTPSDHQGHQGREIIRQESKQERTEMESNRPPFLC